jgi:signal transduction histidine kinase
VSEPKPADARASGLSEAIELARRNALDAIRRSQEAVTASREMRRLRIRTDPAAAADAPIREALQRAQEGSAARDRFMAVVAHEMRQPLHAALAALALARTLLSEQPPVRPIEIAERQLLRLARLIDDLLDTARAAIQQLDVVIEPARVHDVMATVAQEVAPLISASGRELIVALPDETAWVSVDSLRMNQVFRNLLENASRYTPRGSRIWFSGGVDGDRVEVHVRDDGPGISADQRDSIFELFSRGTAEAEGVGIGLALARSLVDRQGGTLALADSPTGADFVVTLPRCAPPAGNA